MLGGEGQWRDFSPVELRLYECKGRRGEGEGGEYGARDADDVYDAESLQGQTDCCRTDLATLPPPCHKIVVEAQSCFRNHKASQHNPACRYIKIISRI